MICPICKNEIKEDSKFCHKCGKLIPRCPTCNKVITKRMRFCINDGTPLPEELLSVLSDLQEVDSIELKQPQKNKAAKTTIEATDSMSEKVVPKKKKRLLPLLCVMLLGIAGVLCYSIYNGNIKLGLFTQTVTENTKTEKEADEEKPIIDRSTTDKEETEAESTLLIDTNESVENTTAPSTEEIIKEEANNESETESTIQEVVEIDFVEYFILNCDREYFTKEDLSVFDADMCRVARNGIYARLGRKFQDEALTAYFLKYDWYTPTINPDDFSDELLNEYQTANRDLIVEYEKEQGYR